MSDSQRKMVVYECGFCKQTLIRREDDHPPQQTEGGSCPEHPNKRHLWVKKGTA